MSNYLSSAQTPPILPKSPEDIIRTLQLQLAQRALGGSGSAPPSYRHPRDKRKAPHEDPAWDSRVTELGPGGEESTAVKRRGNQCAERAGELRQYLDVLQQHEAEPCTLAPSPPSPPSSPPPSKEVAFMRLPCPVIIPQRRIMNRPRGFVCNYSSSLRGAGINEKAFSNFINQLNRLAELKPRAQAIDFTGFAHLCSNTHHDLFVSMAIGMAIETAKDIQHSTAINKLVDKANDDLFKPKGLVCLLMTWKPDGPESSSPGCGIRARAVQLVKSERRGRTKRSKAKLNPFQGMGMFEWPKPMPLNRVDGDVNLLLPETEIPTAFSQHHIRNHSTKSIYQESQRPVVHHLEDRNTSQTAAIDIGAPVHFQEGIPFQLAENGGLAPLKSQGQITLTNLSECSPTEEKETSDCNLSSFWNPAAVMSAGAAEKGRTDDRYRRRDLEDSDLSISILSPSFTTGALKTLETDTLYILIANIPDDVEAEKDTNWES